MIFPDHTHLLLEYSIRMKRVITYTKLINEESLIKIRQLFRRISDNINIF